MSSRELARIASGPRDYARVYRQTLRNLQRPAIIHWLGAAFDPALAGYWGHAGLDRGAEACLEIIAANVSWVDGIKVSLLDERREVELPASPTGRRANVHGRRLQLSAADRGGQQGHSHALLGIFDAIAPAASAALQALDRGDAARYREILEPTVPLSRHIFQAPTYHYKTGIVFLAYLNGHQRHFRMVGGQEAMRSVVHLAELFVLADRAHLFSDPELASDRMRHVLALAGID